MPEHEHHKHLVIHGHFYQPPRENPWTDRIDRQDGAAPYHDWNEKITAECYTPNTCSRRLDGYGRITKLLNNYEWISFNFGPTLLSWLEAKHPGTYGKILDADRRSAGRLGHGNAIAQAYNHIIMPLATRRDQETQIRWGVRDFERRFGREPEGIWLPETAINEALIDILIEFGFRFIILSPHQADGVRTIRSSGRWKNVQDGSVPTGVPYRCFGHGPSGKRDTRRFIDVFFYDASLSVDVSFNHLLRNGDSLATAISASYARDNSDLAVIATDGEIYGHHEPFADMALSYLADVAAPAGGIAMTNFGAYLDTHEPEWEVHLKPGRNGEGTAWSCAHGMGRWKEDCGCNVGAPAGWNQKWRSPLRTGLDALRDELAAAFEQSGAGLFADPWKARDEYSAVILERSVEKAERFVGEHAPRELAPEERSRALSLLESQRFAQLMFTSCGWFFNDISGVESVQLLRYAARAIELADGERRERFETLLRGELAKALSNVPEARTGADIYARGVATAAIDASFIAGQHAILAHFFGVEEASRVFKYTVRTMDRIERTGGRNSLSSGHIEIVSPYTLEHHEFQYVVAVEDAAAVTCNVKPAAEGGPFRETADRFLGMPEERFAADIARTARDEFGGRHIDLKDLFIEDRERILLHLCHGIMGSVLERYEKLFDENRSLLRLLRDAGIAPPLSLSVPVQAVLTRRLVNEVERWQPTIEPGGLGGIKEIVTDADAHGIRIDTTSASRAFRDVVLERSSRFEERLDADAADALFEFVELSHALDITIEMHDIQNEIFRILETTVGAAIESLRGAGGEAGHPEPSAGDGAATRRAVESFLNLARRFNFNTDSYEERLPRNTPAVL